MKKMLKLCSLMLALLLALSPFSALAEFQPVPVGEPGHGTREYVEPPEGDWLQPYSEIVNIRTVKNTVALTVNYLSLLVHNIVKAKNITACGKVIALNLFLRILNLTCKYFVFNRHIARLTETVENVIESVACEKTDNVVLGREEETACTGVALTSGTSS